MAAGYNTRSAYLIVNRTTEEASITVRTANLPFRHNPVGPPGSVEAGIATPEALGPVALRPNIKGTLTAQLGAPPGLETLDWSMSALDPRTTRSGRAKRTPTAPQTPSGCPHSARTRTMAKPTNHAADETGGNVTGPLPRARGRDERLRQNGIFQTTTR